MRNQQLSQFFPPVLGGEERLVFTLAQTLASRNEVVVGTYGAEVVVDEVEGLQVHRIRPTTSRIPGVYQGDRQFAAPAPDPAVSRGLGRLIDEFQPDVVHAHNWIVHSILPLRRRTSAAMLLTLHDFSQVCSIKRYMFMDEALCPGPTPRRCIPCTRQHYRGPVGPLTYAGLVGTRPWKRRVLDHVLAVSRAVAEGNQLSRFGVPWDVVPNFVSDELGRDRAQLARPDWLPDGAYWLFAGDLSHDKGVPTLLAAYGSLPESRPPLVLVGRRTTDTPTELPEGVVLVGPRPHAEVLAAFAGAVLAVVPSICPDACPTVVLEAMAHGVPVVGTAIGGMVDMIRDGVDGRLVTPGDAGELASALWELQEAPQVRQAMGEAALHQVTRFRASAVVARVEEVYQEVVATGRRRRTAAEQGR